MKTRWTIFSILTISVIVFSAILFLPAFARISCGHQASVKASSLDDAYPYPYPPPDPYPYPYPYPPPEPSNFCLFVPQVFDGFPDILETSTLTRTPTYFVRTPTRVPTRYTRTPYSTATCTADGICPPTFTPTRTYTITPNRTFTRTITLTRTVTLTPTMTATCTADGICPPTLTPTYTRTPTPVLPSRTPTFTAIVPIYPRTPTRTPTRFPPVLVTPTIAQ